MLGQTGREGFRSEVMFMRQLSEIQEKNPSMPRPRVSFEDFKGTAMFWISYYELEPNYRKRTKEEMEAEIELIVNCFPSAAWTANAPEPGATDYSHSNVYYVLIGVLPEGGEVRITAMRESLCELVTVSEREVSEEVPDPDLVQNVPKVKLTRTEKIQEWQCNERLQVLTLPGSLKDHVQHGQTLDA